MRNLLKRKWFWYILTALVMLVIGYFLFTPSTHVPKT